MPIDIERFEDTEGLDESTTTERIVGFLIEHDDRAYTRGEIADAIDVNPETVGTNLTRLKARDLVRHREPYWAFTDDHEQARAVLQERGMEDLTALVPATDREDSQKAGPSRRDPSGTDGTDGPHRAAASAFVDRVRDRFGGAIEALYVFGSVARGSESTTSDVDVLVVVADEADLRTTDDQLLALAFDVQLEYDVRIEVHSMPASEFEARRDRGEPFVRTVVEEGIHRD